MLGAWAQNIANASLFLDTDNPSSSLRKELFLHAQKPEVIRKLLSNNILLFNLGLESIPDNLDTALHQAIQQAPKSLAEEKKREQMRQKNIPVI